MRSSQRQYTWPALTNYTADTTAAAPLFGLSCTLAVLFAFLPADEGSCTYIALFPLLRCKTITGFFSWYSRAELLRILAVLYEPLSVDVYTDTILTETRLQRPRPIVERFGLSIDKYSLYLRSC